MAVRLALESWPDYRCGSLTAEVPGVEITFAQRGVSCVRFIGGLQAVDETLILYADLPLHVPLSQRLRHGCNRTGHILPIGLPVAYRHSHATLPSPGGIAE